MALTIFDKLLGSLDHHASGDIEPEQIYRSISTHLMRLLNSRRGSLSHLPDYGIPDLAEIYQNLPYSINRLIQAMKQTIEKYEPRLVKVRVIQKPATNNDYLLHLEIHGQLFSGELMQFDSFFSFDGRTRIGM